MANKDLQEQRQKYGVDLLTPDVLHEALLKRQAQYAPLESDVQKFGDKAQAASQQQNTDYAEHLYSVLAPRLPFDQPQQVQMPAEEISAPAPRRSDGRSRQVLSQPSAPSSPSPPPEDPEVADSQVLYPAPGGQQPPVTAQAEAPNGSTGG